MHVACFRMRFGWAAARNHLRSRIWPRAGTCRVQKGMQSGKDDVTVSLAKPVPVFIVYGTALTYENGEVHFSDYIYGHDANLAAALAKGYPYP